MVVALRVRRLVENQPTDHEPNEPGKQRDDDWAFTDLVPYRLAPFAPIPLSVREAVPHLPRVAFPLVISLARQIRCAPGGVADDVFGFVRQLLNSSSRLVGTSISLNL